ncbi:MAG: aryl-sulfate sulfotransferase [Bacteroidota bacterium]|nr:aryl-sulfate sulfotransferase [Bacteroidota bacterium]MDP4230590.1 aryl-sulfate sulfotransferase [Bacteroidota bacterium]MDP4236246.1 aryl-sulfate sulfotransferase [Bacteroidota bacterium]
MKIFYFVLFATYLFPITVVQAQNPSTSSGSSKFLIEYQWPKNEETDVPQRTTFVIRPTKAFMTGRSANDFAFDVRGSLSGWHSGRVLISDDAQTIIFKPDQPFGLSESVRVQFNMPGVENFTPLSYTFHTTDLSEIDRGKILYRFYQDEQAENEQAASGALENQDTIASPRDSIHIDLPLNPVIDTVSNTAAGNIFFTATRGFPSPSSYLATIDDTGRILIDSNVAGGCGNFKMESDGTLTYFKQTSAPQGGIFNGFYVHVDRNMRLIDTFQCVGFDCDLHDFHLMRNGHAILVAYVPRIHVDLTQLPGAPACAKTEDTVFDAVIQELDASKNLVMQWNSKDHLLITEATPDINLCGTKLDYCHINTAEIDSTDGNMIASFRHMEEITKINWSTGETIWRWGGKHNMFTFSGPNPDDTLKFSHQHDPARLDNKHITVWDNGNLRPRDTTIGGKDTIVNKPFSRAVEYLVDEVNHTATVTWDFRNVPFSVAAGNVQRLGNGNTFMSMGLVSGPSPDGGRPSIIEVNPQNQIVFQASFANNSFIYRAYRFELTPSAVKQTGTASSFGVTGIYPNPAQQTTTLAFTVKEPGWMQIDLADILGKNRRSIREKISSAGAYTSEFDIHDLPAGTYYCRLSQHGNVVVKMLVVQK